MSETSGVKIPPVYCPIEPKIADKYEEAQLFADDWCSKMRFFPNDKALKRFHCARFGWLSARAYADASEEMVKLLSMWLSFTFLLDDQCEKRIGTEPEQLRNFFSRFTAYLRSPKDTVMEGKGPLFEALQDIWERTLPNAPTESWPERFIEDLSNYFESNAWEAANKKAGRVPSLEEYIHWRQFSVGCYPFFDLSEVTQNIKKPENFPELDRLSTMANHLVAFFNDIISLEKELPTGDCHNLVLVLQNEMKCSLQVAMDRAVEMHNLEMRDFLELEAQIRKGERFDVHVSEYINGLRYWIRGNLDWSYESGRYLPDGATPNDLIISYFSPASQ